MLTAFQCETAAYFDDDEYTCRSCMELNTPQVNEDYHYEELLEEFVAKNKTDPSYWEDKELRKKARELATEYREEHNIQCYSHYDIDSLEDEEGGIWCDGCDTWIREPIDTNGEYPNGDYEEFSLTDDEKEELDVFDLGPDEAA